MRVSRATPNKKRFSHLDELNISVSFAGQKEHVGVGVVQRDKNPATFRKNTNIINEMQLRRKMLMAFLTYPEDMSKLSDFCGCDRLRMSRMISSLERSCILRNVVS